MTINIESPFLRVRLLLRPLIRFDRFWWKAKLVVLPKVQDLLRFQLILVFIVSHRGHLAAELIEARGGHLHVHRRVITYSGGGSSVLVGR